MILLKKELNNFIIESDITLLKRNLKILINSKIEFKETTFYNKKKEVQNGKKERI